MERKEGQLWRIALVLLILLATTLAFLSWDSIRESPVHLKPLPIGLVVLVLLFGAYVLTKTKEIAELRGLVRGFEHRAGAAPSEKQLEQIFTLVQRSQQGYRDLIDTFDDLLFALSLEGEIRAANRRLAELLELPFNAIIGHRLDEFLDDPEGSQREAVRRALPRFLEQRHWAGVVRARLRKSGAVLYFDCVLHAMVKNDQPVGVSVLARDITQEREGEARFTELFETLQEGVYFITPEGRLLDANPALVRMLGYDSKEELLGVRFNDLYVDMSQLAAMQGELEKQGHLHQREINLRRKDGVPIVCLYTAAAIRDAGGRIIRHQGTLVEITERREMEKRLHQEQEFARSLVNSFPDLIVVLDLNQRYTFVSLRIKDVLGYSPEELLGRSLGERTSPEDQPALLELFHKLVSGEQAFGDVEYRTHHKEGKWRLFRASACPLFDEEGKIAGVIASARDVTELKRLEQQVMQSEKLAAMGQMIAGVAHELNNPLTAILGVSELLRDRAQDDTTRRQLDLAHRQARRAANIVQSLLAFSRPATPKTEKLDLNDVVKRTLQLQEQSLRANNITVEFTPKPGLPSVAGDAGQLTQVFLNLITNAEQAIGEIRNHGTLKIHLGHLGNSVLATLQDDGPGIRPEVLPRIFDPFFTTKRPGGGTGLGLTICMAIVREHGGSIEASSRPGGGAVFTVSLPLEKRSTVLATPVGSEQEGIHRPQTPGKNRCEFTSLRRRFVLVVDDEESIRELVQDGLIAQGLVVDSAPNGEQALRLATARDYDAIICDLNLANPETQTLSGKQLLERLQAELGGQKIVFILMTGSLVNASSEGLTGLGGARVIQKPFRISDLLAILAEELGSKAPIQEIPAT